MSKRRLITRTQRLLLTQECEAEDGRERELLAEPDALSATTAEPNKRSKRSGGSGVHRSSGSSND
jgi:hypothetical protein